MVGDYSLVGFASCNGCGIWYEDPEFPDEMGTPIPGRDLVDLRKELRAAGWKITQKRAAPSLWPSENFIDQRYLSEDTTALCPDCKTPSSEYDDCGLTWQWSCQCTCSEEPNVDMDWGDLVAFKDMWRFHGHITRAGLFTCRLKAI